MIQRIQTLYLLIAFISCILMPFFPLAVFQTTTVSYEMYIHRILFTATEQTQVFQLNMLMASTLLIVAALIVVSVFSFANRPRQMKIVAVAFLFNALMIGGIFYFADVFGKKHQIQPNYENIGTLFPFVILILLVLSQRAIKHDQMKIRKSQRIR
jgi:hypothetical protein